MRILGIYLALDIIIILHTDRGIILVLLRRGSDFGSLLVGLFGMRGCEDGGEERKEEESG